MSSDPAFRLRLTENSARLGTLRRDLCRTMAAVPMPDDRLVAQLWMTPGGSPAPDAHGVERKQAPPALSDRALCGRRRHAQWGRWSRQPPPSCCPVGSNSATVLAIARADGYECHCLTVDYGSGTASSSPPRAPSRELSAPPPTASSRVDLRAIGARPQPPRSRSKDRPPDPSHRADHLCTRAEQHPARAAVGLRGHRGRRSVHRRQAVDYSGYPDWPAALSRGLRAARKLRHQLPRPSVGCGITSTRRCST